MFRTFSFRSAPIQCVYLCVTYYHMRAPGAPADTFVRHKHVVGCSLSFAALLTALKGLRAYVAGDGGGGGATAAAVAAVADAARPDDRHPGGLGGGGAARPQRVCAAAAGGAATPAAAPSRRGHCVGIRGHRPSVAGRGPLGGRSRLGCGALCAHARRRRWRRRSRAWGRWRRGGGRRAEVPARAPPPRHVGDAHASGRAYPWGVVSKDEVRAVCTAAAHATAAGDGGGGLRALSWALER